MADSHISASGHVTETQTHHMQGFRKYARIRETLVHELTHNVWGDHDNNFKTLNSQLLRQCMRMSQARILGGDPVRAC